jgi:CubicO group peptidase (beta-lactamase class C family)
MKGLPLDFDPGERFAYSNFGYIVLGRVIERASGIPYEDFARARVLEPVEVLLATQLEHQRDAMAFRLPGRGPGADHLWRRLLLRSG